MMMRVSAKGVSIEEHWQSYRLVCVPRDAVPEQLYQLRIAFYAGVQLMLDIEGFIAEIDELHGMATLTAIHREMAAFRRSDTGRREGERS